MPPATCPNHRAYRLPEDLSARDSIRATPQVITKRILDEKHGMAFMFEKLEVYQKAVDFGELIAALTE